MNEQYECVFISNWPHDANCYQCGRSREEHDKGTATVNIAPSTAIPEDAEASLSEWYDEVERNQLQSKRDAEEKEWYENERSRAATADYEYQVEEEE